MALLRGLRAAFMRLLQLATDGLRGAVSRKPPRGDIVSTTHTCRTHDATLSVRCWGLRGARAGRLGQLAASEHLCYLARAPSNQLHVAAEQRGWSFVGRLARRHDEESQRKDDGYCADRASASRADGSAASA